MPDIGKGSGIVAGCVLCGFGLLYSYQADPSAKDAARVAAIPEEPGGTPEDRLWEVLILASVGEDKPANWDVPTVIERQVMTDVDNLAAARLPDVSMLLHVRDTGSGHVIDAAQLQRLTIRYSGD